MRRDWRVLFKDVAAQTASKCRVRFGTFMRDWGLRDFLIEAFDRGDSPQEIAARALDQLSVNEGRLRDMVVCLTVTQFLNETVGTPSQDPGMQRVADLLETVRASGDYAAYLQWVKSWYA